MARERRIGLQVDDVVDPQPEKLALKSVPGGEDSLVDGRQELPACPIRIGVRHAASAGDLTVVAEFLIAVARSRRQRCWIELSDNFPSVTGIRPDGVPHRH